MGYHSGRASRGTAIRSAASRHRRRTTAFTLIEMAIILGLIGILASVALPLYDRFMMKAKQSEAPLIITKIAEAEIAYWLKPRLNSVGAPMSPCFLWAAGGPITPGPQRQPWTPNPVVSSAQTNMLQSLGVSMSSGVYFSYATGPASLVGAPVYRGFCQTPMSAAAATVPGNVLHISGAGDLDGDGFTSLASLGRFLGSEPVYAFDCYDIEELYYLTSISVNNSLQPSLSGLKVIQQTGTYCF